MNAKRSIKVLKRKQKQKRMMASHTTNQVVRRKGNHDPFSGAMAAALIMATFLKRIC